MTDFERRILRTFMHDPYSVYQLKQFAYNKDHAYKVLNKYFPTDTGIELEIGEDAVNALYGNLGRRRGLSRSYHRDSCFEITKRFYKAKGLFSYNSLGVLIKFLLEDCEFPENGGIHIHTNVFGVNIHDLRRQFPNGIQEYIDLTNGSQLPKTLSDLCRYTGNYNGITAGIGKCHVINFREDFNTIEYRCISIQKSLFDLMKIIAACHLCTRMIINKSIDLDKLNDLMSI